MRVSKTLRIVLLLSALTFGFGGSALAELVTNGGFETGDFSGWTLSPNFDANNSVTLDLADTGTFSALLGQTGSTAYISQDLITSPGTTYTLQFALFSDGAYDLVSPNQFIAEFGGAFFFNQSNIDSTGWMHQQYDLIASAASTTLKFSFRDDLGYLNLDSVSVAPTPGAPVPIPGAVWLLGSGLLGLISAKLKYSA